MKKVPFPFANTCYFMFEQGQQKLAPVKAEEAVTADEVYQALNYRNAASFHQPLVLHFEETSRQTPVWFGFSFDVEVIVVDTNGLVKKTFEMPKMKEGSGIFIQLFGDCSFAILVPKGFCKKWHVQEEVTFAKRTSLHQLLSKKTG